ncbi:MAG: hypothetical protein GY932_02900 [Arcobacter sp.]|nr:hypothetical protein [Arcobacter sp.]
MKTKIILTLLSLFLLSGCIGGDNSKQEWTSLIYPDKNNTKRSKKHGVYSTLKECKETSIKELENLNLISRGDYQCGLNCSYHDGMKVDICEKMSK